MEETDNTVPVLIGLLEGTSGGLFYFLPLVVQAASSTALTGSAFLVFALLFLRHPIDERPTAICLAPEIPAQRGAKCSRADLEEDGDSVVPEKEREEWREYSGSGRVDQGRRGGHAVNEGVSPQPTARIGWWTDCSSSFQRSSCCCTAYGGADV